MKGRRSQPVHQSHFPAAKSKDSDHNRPLYHRDSDTSHCSRRSSALSKPETLVLLTDRSQQTAALKSINSHFSSHSFPLLLKSLPSARDITDAFRFLLRSLDWDMSKLDDDVPFILKQLGCPLKLNKSAFKAPGTPHSWPALLSAMNWLVQFIRYKEHLESGPPFYSDNEMLQYVLRGYMHFLRGEDEPIDALDQEFMQKLQTEKEIADQNLKTLEKEVKDLEAKVQAIRSGPSPSQVLEKKKSDLMEDIQKFQTVIDTYSTNVAALEKGLEEKRKELELKLQENRRICDENKELQLRVDSQTVNVRDAEKMKRELQAVEVDMAETELARNAWEEKAWDLEASLRSKVGELEGLVDECNQAIRRLKVGIEYQYVLNGKGSSPAEVLGTDYKSTLKPLLTAFLEDVKRNSVTKWEECISLQKELSENATKLEAKQNKNADLMEKIDKIEAQQKLLKMEIQDHVSECAAESDKLRKDVENRIHQLDIKEREAEEFLKEERLKLQEVRKYYDEEIQRCGGELLLIIDAISAHKEHMGTVFLAMQGAVYETTDSVAETFNTSYLETLGDVCPAR